MKIIFLDIDGVLNNQVMHETGEELIGTVGGKLSKKCIMLLNDLVKETGAKIVISSSWRVDDNIEEVLTKAGVVAEFIGKTPYLTESYCFRGNEIHDWICKNEQLIGKPYYDFHSYVIIDDDSDMLYWQRENFFQTDSYSGLTPNIAYKAKRFLNRF
jgi:histidinol phosphatase-like enzyme